jgi:hypothetical protein
MIFLVTILRTKFLLVALCAVAVVLVIGCSPATRSEPSYNGRTLSEWLIEYNAAEKLGGARETNAITAIRAIGSNAAPFLVKWINVDYTLPEYLIDLAVWGYEPSRIKRGNRAMRAFQILGTNAAPAIPGLTNIIWQDKGHSSLADARYALVYIGPPGVAALCMLATNKLAPDHLTTVSILGASGETGAGDIAKATLTNSLADPDPQVRYITECALAEIARDEESRTKAK